jgi:TonB family protein
MSDVRKSVSDEIPATIGRYQITGSLGYGAMGAVYRAFDPLIKRPLAIKTVRLDIPRQSPQYRGFIERFQHEAEISGTLSHPGIVTLFDLGEDNGFPFFAMEFVDGRTIAEVLAEGERFKPEKVIGLVSQVASALDYAHSRGVVHRDIKPANLMLYDGDKVKVTDFGIAKLQDADITHSGALLGTPSYMSPEQAMGDKLDGRSDIFSLGVVAFEMLSGRQPFPGPNVTSILYKLVHTDPVEPPDLELLGLVPEKWREVFQKVLAKKPEERYQTASAFVQDLEYCLGSWFTGLGEETVTLHVKAPSPSEAVSADVVTATIPRLPALAPPARSAGSPALARQADEKTMVRAPCASPGVEAEPPAATLVLSPPPVAPGEPPPTLVSSAEITAISPPEAAQAAPPAPAEPRPETPPAFAPARPTLRRQPGLPLSLVLGGGAAVVALLGLATWTLWPHASAATAAPQAQAPAPAEPARPVPPKAEAAPAPSAARRSAPRPPRAAAPSSGLADVLSNPPGAAVSVDGQPVGETPLRGLKLQPGRRRLELALAGYETWTSALEVVAGVAGRVDVRLQSRPAPPPTPVPVDTARIYPNEAGEVDTLARRISGSSPSYPSGRAPRLRSGERVSVLLRIVVSETGEVADVTVVESGGPVLDEVVVGAVKRWRYEPATRGGVKVKVETRFRQTFLGA